MTGAAGGIGRAAARALCTEGAQLALWDLDGERLQEFAREVAGADPEIAPVDVSDPESVRSGMESVLGRLGRVDVLVHAAGVMSVDRIDACSPEEWERTLRVNLGGTFHVCRAVLEPMRAAGRGRIVLVSSAAAESAGTVTGIAYAASKSGMLAISRQLAFQEARNGLRVNTVAPGFVDTDMPRSHFSAEMIRQSVESFPTPRMATAEEVAHAILFLASDAADYVNGETLYITGGSFID